MTGEMPDDLDVLAAEYVLGTLDAGERANFTARLVSDADAGRLVRAWENRLGGLALNEPGTPPSAHVWTRIERALPGAARTLPFEVVAGGAFLTTSVLKASRNRWRAAALMSGTIAAALLVFVGERAILGVAPSPDDVTYIAAVNRGGEKPALIVRVNLKTRQVLVRPVSAEAPAGHSLELWYIGDDKPPRAMGLLDQRPATLAVPRGATVSQATFAVSVEPPGGSPTGAPTGPVVYSVSLIKE